MLKRASNEEEIKQRKDEIVSVVSKMYGEMDYQDISMKTISERISIARSSLYCYYPNKEEIMLDVLKDGFMDWFKELTAFLSGDKKDDKDLADGIGDIYLSHLRMMEIISIHLTDIEEHCSLSSLVAFKSSFVPLFAELSSALKSQFPKASQESLDGFFDSLIMLNHSLYPMIYPNINQRKAMETVGMKVVTDAKEFTHRYILFLLDKMN